jgi:hypothetical protein
LLRRGHVNVVRDGKPHRKVTGPVTIALRKRGRYHSLAALGPLLMRPIMNFQPFQNTQQLSDNRLHASTTLQELCRVRRADTRAHGINTAIVGKRANIKTIVRHLSTNIKTTVASSVYILRRAVQGRLPAVLRPLTVHSDGPDRPKTCRPPTPPTPPPRHQCEMRTHHQGK